MSAVIQLPRAGIHCQVHLAKGRGRQAPRRLGTFYNLVVKGGLNNLASSMFSALVTHCHCGTGSAPVAVNNTVLANFLAGTNNLVETNESAKAIAPYFSRAVRTFRFVAGTFDGDIITEVGFSNQATDGGLFSRALVEVPDRFNDPTAMLIRDDEWLDVAYEFRLYPSFINADGSLNDGTGVIDVNGVGHGYAIRPANVSNLLYWKALEATAAFKAVSGSYGTSYAAGSVLGLVTNSASLPSGAAADSGDSSIYALPYTADSYNRDIILAVGPGDFNASGGVGAIRFNTGFGSYQMSFSPAVPKTSGGSWNFKLNLAWDNVVI